MITFAIESWDQLVPELKKLTYPHWEEIGSYDKVRMPLSPDWEVYKVLNDAGKLVGVSARNQEDELVGYVVFIVSTNHHYSDSLVAESDIIFLLPKYRKGLTGYRMIKFAVRALRNINVDGKPMGTIALSMKVEHSFDAIAKRLSFRPLDIKYIMEV